MRIASVAALLAVALTGCFSLETGEPGGTRGDDDGGPSGDDDPGPGPGPGDPGSSGGSGGTPTDGAFATRTAANGKSYSFHTPAAYSASTPAPLLLAVSGTEGRATYTQVFSQIYAQRSESYIVIVVGGPDVGQGGDAGDLLSDIVGEVRSDFNVDLSRQYLNTVSYGTIAGLQLVMSLEQDQFAAAWFTAPVANTTPAESAQQLGFVPAIGVAYGTSSNDVGNADSLRTAATAKGYDPVVDFPRSGGHSPGVPSAEWNAMWELFATHAR